MTPKTLQPSLSWGDLSVGVPHGPRDPPTLLELGGPRQGPWQRGPPHPQEGHAGGPQPHRAYGSELRATLT